MASSQRTLLGAAVYEDFQPKIEYTETPDAHFLHVHLPGFRRDQVKIRYVSSIKSLSISGEKPEEFASNKWIRFDEAVPVPENCEVSRLVGKFDKGILTITMPKKYISPVVPRKELRTTTSEEEISQDSSPYEEFQPKVEKTENLEAYLLHVYLPGFSKDQVKIKYLGSSRMISISGEKPIEGENRWSRFDQAYPVPENFNEERLGAKFDQGILTVTMPKKLTLVFAPREEVKTSHDDSGLSPLESAMAEPSWPLQKLTEEVIIPPKPIASVLNQEEIVQKDSIGAAYEEFQPMSEMIENLETYQLKIHLPGFTKDQVKIKYISSSRVLRISGETQTGGAVNRWIRVDQSYPVPENCDAERVRGKFDQGILTLTIPKKFIPQQLAPKQEQAPHRFPTAPSSVEGLADTQKGKEEFLPKPTILRMIDEQAAPKSAGVREGKNMEDVVEMIGKGIQGVAASASNAVTNMGDGRLNDEEKHLMAVVIAALGAYVSHRLNASGKPYNNNY